MLWEAFENKVSSYCWHFWSALLLAAAVPRKAGDVIRRPDHAEFQGWAGPMSLRRGELAISSQRPARLRLPAPPLRENSIVMAWTHTMKDPEATPRSKTNPSDSFENLTVCPALSWAQASLDETYPPNCHYTHFLE